MTDGGLRFAVATFERVFDVTPVQDALTLPELTAALARFLLKPKLAARIAAEVAAIERALDAVIAGDEAPAGKPGAALAKAMAAAREGGGDEMEAARARAEALVADAQRGAKRDMRLWAPLLFRPGGRRETEDVLHASCLVLDYDDGTPIDEAVATWRPYFHIVHTTWSHTAARPRFRLVLPLARPVTPAGFARLWAWAEERSGLAIDPTGKGVARAYALPAVASPEAERDARVSPGPLLDAAVAGVDDDAPPPLPDASALARGLLRPQADDAVVQGPSARSVDLDDDAVWDGGATVEAPPWSPRDEAAPASAATGLDGAQILARLDRLEARLEARLDELGRHALVDGLERLALLYEQGAIDASEYRAAKARLLP